VSDFYFQNADSDTARIRIAGRRFENGNFSAISVFKSLPAMWICAISLDRDLKIYFSESHLSCKTVSGLTNVFPPTLSVTM